MSATKKIFVSYRRDDDGAYLVPELNRKLTTQFGDGSVFYDIDNIPLGVDFRDYLSNAISTAAIVLVVIGDRWAGYDAATGLRRIDREDDFVRIEVESALNRSIPVVPVLVGKAKMPSEKELPPSIAKLAFRNAAEIRTGKDYDLHMSELLRGLDAIMAPKQGSAFVHDQPVSDTPLLDIAVARDREAISANERFMQQLQAMSLARTSTWKGRSTSGGNMNVTLLRRGFNLKVVAAKKSTHILCWIRLPNAGWSANLEAMQDLSHCKMRLQEAITPYVLEWKEPNAGLLTGYIRFSVDGGYQCPEAEWPKIHATVLGNLIPFESELRVALERQT